jgi:hypothetical protein
LKAHREPAAIAAENPAQIALNEDVMWTRGLGS